MGDDEDDRLIRNMQKIMVRHKKHEMIDLKIIDHVSITRNSI